VELKSVEDFRSAINEIDDQLLEMLSYRMKVVDDIAQFKKQHNMTIFQEGTMERADGPPSGERQARKDSARSSSSSSSAPSIRRASTNRRGFSTLRFSVHLLSLKEKKQ
jgi:hypothetical protein